MKGDRDIVVQILVALIISMLILCVAFYFNNQRKVYASKELSPIDEKIIEGYEKVNIEEIVEKYNLDFTKDINKHKKFFKKFAYVVENNNNLNNMNRYVYNLYKILCKNDIYNYLDENYLLTRLSTLIITKEKESTNEWNRYNSDENKITYLEPVVDDEIYYHELFHFLDFSMNNDKNTKSLYYLALTEASAEIYTAKYLVGGYSNYPIASKNLTILEYIVGNKKIDELLLKKEGYYALREIFMYSGLTYNNYVYFLEGLNCATGIEIRCTKEERNEFLVKDIDFLIDIYSAYNINKKWDNDKNFVYLILDFVSYNKDIDLSLSKYYSKISSLLETKNFNDRYTYDLVSKVAGDKVNTNLFEKHMIYVKDGNIYINGTNFDKNKTILKYSYISYDFNTNKLIDNSVGIIK